MKLTTTTTTTTGAAATTATANLNLNSQDKRKTVSSRQLSKLFGAFLSWGTTNCGPYLGIELQLNVEILRFDLETETNYS